jgi:probable F420-dependent oxidoreductase
MARHRLAFGVTCGFSATREEWRTFCALAETLGCRSLVVSDHFGDQLALIPALGAAIEATSRLRVGALVACNDFRHPIVYAKELATLDVFSEGRVDWGIGAGWLAAEYNRVGIDFAPRSVRVERLAEAITVMKGLFSDEPLHFAGTHYKVDGLLGKPTPIQRPHPPLLVGGAARRMLSLAGEQADAVGIAPSLRARSLGSAPPRCSVEEAFDQQLGWIKDAAGSRFDDIDLNVVVQPVAVTAHRKAVAERVAAGLGYTPEQVLRSPHVLIGSVDEICERVTECRERWGISYWTIPARVLESMAPVIERLSGT